MSEQELIDEGYVDGKKSFAHISKLIHEEFNWENVHKAMKALDWCWKMGVDEFGKDRMGIPSLDTIKNSAYSLLKQAYDTGNHISTGGFSAGWEDGQLYLIFTLEEASA